MNAGKLKQDKIHTERESDKLLVGNVFDFSGMSGAPRRIRTPDPQIRSLVLYPAELSAPGRCLNRCVDTA